jgi:DNA polymerase-3 subunit delta'
MPTLQGVYADLVGQEHVVEILQKAVLATRTGEETQEMTHAWVFTGPPGSGRSSAAVAFAQALVCTNNGCGTCNECQSAANGAHPDVEIIRTEGLSIKIDEVRELLTRVAWAPSMGLATELCGFCVHQLCMMFFQQFDHVVVTYN